jgi:pectin methylesterase-like acyl-CoA thioesterase
MSAQRSAHRARNRHEVAVALVVTSTQFVMDRVTIVPDVNTGFSVAGYQTLTSGVTFTHLLRRCYIYGSTIGVDFSWGNNYVLDQCFIESNGTNVRAGFVDTVTNLVVCNGSVIEHFGDGVSSPSL